MRRQFGGKASGGLIDRLMDHDRLLSAFLVLCYQPPAVKHPTERRKTTRRAEAKSASTSDLYPPWVS